MPDCRDWLTTLWAVSFKGVPFYFESDDEEGGRGLVIHKFPNRDQPFIEDLGEEPRFFSGAAYVHGDDVDSLESSLKQALASRGAGTLVVPLSGPVTVHCQSFKRQHQRDKLGYVAFDIKFVRDGAVSGLISIPLAMNSAFGAAETLAAAVASLFPASILTFGQPDYVVASAVHEMLRAAATLDVIRSSYRVDPTASATIRDVLADIILDAPRALTADTDTPDAALAIAADLVGAARSLADAIPPESAVTAMLQFVSAFEAIGAPGYLTPAGMRAADNVAVVARLARLAGLTAYSEAVIRRSYASRPDGVTARAEVAERFENEQYDTAGAANAALYLAIDDLRGKVIDYLSRVITDLAPIITVETARILPSLYLAYRLYADPLRADELVARNEVRHPSYMPRVISALSR